jgi:hypothetical protein
MAKEIKMNTKMKNVTLDGMMTFGKLENGLHTADFACFEDVQIEAFAGKCKVQVMRDGNVYVTELPKRVKNKPIFREDNSSLSLGRDARYYFCFSLPEQQVERLPELLVNQASSIAKKVIRGLVYSN